MGKVYKRGNAWYISYQYQGKQVRKAIGHSKRVAETVLMDVELKIVKKEYLGIHEEKAIRFDSFAERFLVWSKVHKSQSGYRRDRGIIQNNFVPCFENCHLANITREQVERFIVERNKKVKAPTINREMACLKKLLRLAQDWGYLKQNPAQGVRPLEHQSPEPRYLDKEEIRRLLAECPSHLYPIVVTALNTGMRRGELFHLQWQDVDFKRGLLTVRGGEHTKNYQSRAIPMNESLYEVLRKHPRFVGSPYVFCNKKGERYDNVQTSFENALKRAELGHVRFHDLRHTFASHLVMAGVDLTTVQKLMGHKDIKMTLRYAHLAPEHLKAAVESLNYSSISAPKNRLGVIS